MKVINAPKTKQVSGLAPGELFSVRLYGPPRIAIAQELAEDRAYAILFPTEAEPYFKRSAFAYGDEIVSFGVNWVLRPSFAWDAMLPLGQDAPHPQHLYVSPSGIGIKYLSSDGYGFKNPAFLDLETLQAAHYQPNNVQYFDGYSIWATEDDLTAGLPPIVLVQA